MTLEKIKYKNLTICIEIDEDAENPLLSDDYAPKIALWHRRYENSAPEYKSPEDVFKAHEEGAVIFPMRGYEHGGLALTVAQNAQYPFTDEWDSGFAGFVIFSPERIKELKPDWKAEDPLDQAWLLKSAEQWVETYTEYLNGNVYGYVIRDSLGEEVESCWGFYGYTQVEEEAREIAKNIYLQEQKEFKTYLVYDHSGKTEEIAGKNILHALTESEINTDNLIKIEEKEEK